MDITAKRAGWIAGMCAYTLVWMLFLGLATAFVIQGIPYIRRHEWASAIVSLLGGSTLGILAVLVLLHARSGFTTAWQGQRPRQFSNQPGSLLPFSHDSKNLLARKIWFYYTLLSVGLKYLMGLLVVAGLAWGGIYAITNGAAPIGILALIGAGIVAALLFVRLVIFRYHVILGMRRELRRHNCCPNCSYDLRASEIRCPECGHAMTGENIEI